METSEKILHSRDSKSRVDGTVTTFQIVSRPSGGRPWYPDYIKKLDKIIYIRLIQNGATIDFPLATDEPELFFECMLDVWVKPEKKKYYINRFLGLILRKKTELNF